ncbi:MAG: aconitate hydratase AcnA [Alphaproteobacteria bacterium]
MTVVTGLDTLNVRKTLNVNGKEYDYYSIPDAAKQIGDVTKLPYSLKILLENLLRYQDDRTVNVDDVKAVAKWLDKKTSTHEIAYRPARVLMQDFTGVPAVVDLAAMRDATAKLNGNVQNINPLCPVDLVIDHSLMVDFFGDASSLQKNVDIEFERNQERYEFLRWGQSAFNNFRVVPPGTGICHQVNVEYLAKTVWSDTDQNGKMVAYPDTCVGTDSHTTMVNGLGVLGWGVGGIEAEAAMLGQPVSMLIPEVIGFKLTGTLRDGITATDLVLTVTQMLREKGVVGKFVEFFGEGLDHLSLADRSTIANMAPEYGATCGIFPIDAETINYLRFTGRDEENIALVEAYAKAQGMWRDSSVVADYTDVLELDLDSIRPSLAGPKRPQDRALLENIPTEFAKVEKEFGAGTTQKVRDFDLEDGAVVLTAITSCTNTSNPNVLIAAGLVAKKAVELGLSTKPWVKTSLAPGSQVVTDYLEKAGLTTYLDELGFNNVGYGCTTCIGNSGPLPEDITQAIDDGKLLVNAVLSGNRNFEGRVNPQTRGNWLASPPLVVAYALTGNVKVDITKEPIGKGKDGQDVFLKDIWPSTAEINETLQDCLNSDMYKSRYADVFLGPQQWQDIEITGGETYGWSDNSTYIQNPPYFENMSMEVGDITDIKGAKPLLVLADSITTDHISPAGGFKSDTPAGKFLVDRQVAVKDFNSYGSRRGNHEVMMRGTFANIRIRNELADGTEGGFTTYNGEVTSVYDAAMDYKKDGIPLCVFGGKEYGTGSSRDWAAKGTNLLGVKFVVAESFERIHRSNLVGMGVLPLMFKDGMTRNDLNLSQAKSIDVTGLSNDVKPRQDLTMTITYNDDTTKEVNLLCRIDTIDEVDYYRNGGILHYVLRNMLAN